MIQKDFILIWISYFIESNNFYKWTVEKIYFKVKLLVFPLINCIFKCSFSNFFSDTLECCNKSNIGTWFVLFNLIFRLLSKGLNLHKCLLLRNLVTWKNSQQVPKQISRRKIAKKCRALTLGTFWNSQVKSYGATCFWEVKIQRAFPHSLLVKKENMTPYLFSFPLNRAVYNPV